MFSIKNITCYSSLEVSWQDRFNKESPYIFSFGAVKGYILKNSLFYSRLWKEVTINLKSGNVEKATDYKQGLEQRQREEAKERKEKGLKVETKVGASEPTLNATYYNYEINICLRGKSLILCFQIWFYGDDLSPQIKRFILAT